MKKILIVSNMYPSEKFYSYGIFVKRFCEQLEMIGVRYNLCVMKKNENTFFKIINYIIFFIKSFISYFNKENELIYIHYASHSSIPIILAHKLFKKNIYVNVHGSDIVPENKKQQLFQKYTEKILSIADKVVVPSEYFKEYLGKKYNIKPNKIIVYPSAGVNANVFNVKKTDRNVLKEQFNIKKDIYIFGYVGRISSKKGWDIFLRATKILYEKRQDFQVVIVGEGKEEQKMNDLIKKLKIHNLVRLPLLSQEDLCRIYNCFDCFVFPTMREGESLGLVGLESMACGCPVISSDFAAPKYYVNSLNGLKFEKGNFYDLADKMNTFMNYSKQKIEDLKNGAVKTASEYYIENIIDILKGIVGDFYEG